ncbi:hypothetical protein [Teredinibacter haidensis]|uniref:hypothetical protein n=1 Tax=Teredinibacter haidensis TaxID=2731755 RepID=UPI000948DDA3|nr:hypothetical protein [Teredinibacter haidensis]
MTHYSTWKYTLFCLVSSLLLNAGSVSADNHGTEEAAMPEAEISKAHKYSCSQQGLIRRIEINYSSDAMKVPCDVNYYKDNEAPNEVNTLWSAQNLEGYCEQKAEEFVGKLQSWGWSCSAE